MRKANDTAQNRNSSAIGLKEPTCEANRKVGIRHHSPARIFALSKSISAP